MPFVGRILTLMISSSSLVVPSVLVIMSALFSPQRNIHSAADLEPLGEPSNDEYTPITAACTCSFVFQNSATVIPSCGCRSSHLLQEKPEAITMKQVICIAIFLNIYNPLIE